MHHPLPLLIAVPLHKCSISSSSHLQARRHPLPSIDFPSTRLPHLSPTDPSYLLIFKPYQLFPLRGNEHPRLLLALTLPSLCYDLEVKRLIICAVHAWESHFWYPLPHLLYRTFLSVSLQNLTYGMQPLFRLLNLYFLSLKNFIALSLDHLNNIFPLLVGLERP